MALNENQINRLKNKHKGALGNDKGHQYEDFFAAFCLAQLCQDPIENKDSKIQSQVYAFVDDLLITTNTGRLLYHQLKDVKSLTWAGDLEYDFYSQIQLSNENQEDFHLFLVTSNEKFFNSDIPKTISVYTSNFLFPYFPTMSEFILCHSQFRSSLENILPNCRTNDRLENLGTAILGIWGATGRNITLSELMNRLKGMPFIPLPLYEHEIDSDISTILDKYGFNYTINNDYLQWSYRNFEGLVNIRSLDKASFRNSTSLMDVINLLS